MHWNYLFRYISLPISVAVVSAIVSYMQLRYMKQRDNAADLRNGWTETHKLMMKFVYLRELLNQPSPSVGETFAAASNALGALHDLKGQLDRMPDSPLTNELAKFLHTNWQAENWRSDQFRREFDQYAHKIAVLTR
jgi:hypothetical protein